MPICVNTIDADTKFSLTYNIVCFETKWYDIMHQTLTHLEVCYGLSTKACPSKILDQFHLILYNIYSDHPNFLTILPHTSRASRSSLCVFLTRLSAFYRFGWSDPSVFQAFRAQSNMIAFSTKYILQWSFRYLLLSTILDENSSYCWQVHERYHSLSLSP